MVALILSWSGLVTHGFSLKELQSIAIIPKLKETVLALIYVLYIFLKLEAKG